MLIYEDQRTNSIVAHLVAIASSLRLFTVPIFAVLLGANFGILITLINVALWWLGALLGAILGVALGLLAASYLSALLEWMGQLLVAQGEIISRLEK